MAVFVCAHTHTHTFVLVSKSRNVSRCQRPCRSVLMSYSPCLLLLLLFALCWLFQRAVLCSSFRLNWFVACAMLGIPSAHRSSIRHWSLPNLFATHIHAIFLPCFRKGRINQRTVTTQKAQQWLQLKYYTSTCIHNVKSLLLVSNTVPGQYLIMDSPVFFSPGVPAVDVVTPSSGPSPTMDTTAGKNGCCSASRRKSELRLTVA